MYGSYGRLRDSQCIASGYSVEMISLSRVVSPGVCLRHTDLSVNKDGLFAYYARCLDDNPFKVSRCDQEVKIFTPHLSIYLSY